MKISSVFLACCFFICALAKDVVDSPGDKLVFVQAAWRHGDRTPTKTWPTDQYQEETWPQGWGQLTVTGMKQLAHLGRNRFKPRYIDNFKLINPQYTNKQVYLRSTDYNRTIMSAMSLSVGMFGDNSRKGKDYPDCDDGSCAWPDKYVPVPFHTVPKYMDFVLVPDAECDRLNELKELYPQGEQYKKFMADHKELMDFLSNKTGWTVGYNNFFLITDNLYIMKLYNRTCPDWATEQFQGRNLMEQIAEVQVTFLKWYSGQGLDPVRGVDISREMIKIRGGTLLWSIISHMVMKQRCIEEPANHDCSFISPLTFYGYSSHDNTLAALFATFGLTSPNFDAPGLPKYSESISIELWQSKDSVYYVKLIHWPLGGEETDVTSQVVGCDDPCTLDKFVERSFEYRAVPDKETWCQTPLFGKNGTVLSTNKLFEDRGEGVDWKTDDDMFMDVVEYGHVAKERARKFKNLKINNDF